MNAVALEGVTVFRPAELTPLYDAYLTREVGLSDLTTIATAITDKYRAHGYFLSQAVVPPQAPGTGVARIVVYEGYVSSLETIGDGASAVSPHLATLPGRRPLRLADLDQALGLASDSPGVRLTPRLEPVIDNPAEHRLIVDSQIQRLALSVYADNRGPRTAGPWQAYVDGAINSALRPGDRLGAAVLTAPQHPRDFTYGEVNYSIPIRSGRLRGSIGLSKAHDRADGLSGVAGGESWTVAVALQQPLKRSRTANVWATFTANIRQTEQDWSDVGGYRDEIRLARAAINGNFGPSSKSTTLFGQLSVGERGEAAADRGLSRSDAAQSFWKLNGRAAHYRDLGSKLGLYLSADAQWAPYALLSSEELAVGGAPYGRGYSYAEISGDRGVAASAEIRAGWDPKWSVITFLQGYGFLDAGKVWNAGTGGRSAALASAGLGLRVRLGERTTIGLEAARPLTRTPYEEGDKNWTSSVTLSSRL